mmetsp:Transcript_24760/g.52072  ORF Transcript_24760/g.52072 Transcript_24760/m.52072 type:complete len:134 (-) Transcript_24760:444-845(-)
MCIYFMPPQEKTTCTSNHPRMIKTCRIITGMTGLTVDPTVGLQAEQVAICRVAADPDLDLAVEVAVVIEEIEERIEEGGHPGVLIATVIGIEIEGTADHGNQNLCMIEDIEAGVLAPLSQITIRHRRSYLTKE